MICFWQEPNEKPAKRENPHKYLLYKPTFSQLFTFLSASFKVSLNFNPNRVNVSIVNKPVYKDI